MYLSSQHFLSSCASVCYLCEYKIYFSPCEVNCKLSFSHEVFNVVRTKSDDMEVTTQC